MTLHLVALPNAPLTAAYALDGFSQVLIRFARIFHDLGHHVILYAHEENSAPCTELVPIITNEERLRLLGDGSYWNAASDGKHELWALGNARAIEAIAARKQARDTICLIGGSSQKPIADAHPDLMTVEISIGYLGSFAGYRVFESHAWRHTTYALQGLHDGRFFDTVIPIPFDPAAYPFQADKGEYVLYVGRLTPRKGIGIACDAAKAAGVHLVVVGHGDPSLVTYGEYVGAVDVPTRNALMAGARAVLCPTVYIEPFGSVAVEAQMCGTPVIATNFGGFVETIEHGKTGFRCDYLGEFVQAIRRASDLDPAYIRARAERLYSMAAIAPKYQRYFEKLALLWGEGWTSLDAA